MGGGPSPAGILRGGASSRNFEKFQFFSEPMILNLKSQSLDDAVKKWKILVSRRFFIFSFPKHYRTNVIFWLTENSSFRNPEYQTADNDLFWFTKKSRSHSEISLLFPEEFTGNTFIQTCQVFLLKNDVARYLITRTSIILVVEADCDPQSSKLYNHSITQSNLILMTRNTNYLIATSFLYHRNVISSTDY